MIKDLILDVLFPKKCIACGKEGKYVCKDCELYMLDVPKTAGLTVLWEYNGIVKELVHRIKFNGEYEIIKELLDKKGFEIAEDAVITYVPMHVRKQKKRGFNQAEIIAMEIGKKSNKPVIKMLEKVRQTKDQASLNKEERLKNLKNTFCFCGRPGLPQNVVLVDDVYTSGATMQECCRTLRNGGINNIQGFVIARTV